MRSHPKLGAIAVVPRGGRVLLVARAKAPNRGLWGFPGGHVELGETGLAAAARELAEETGVMAEPLRYLGNIDLIAREDGRIAYHYLLAAVLCEYRSGEPVAADDALDARWVAPDEMAALPLTPNVDRVLSWLDG